MSNTLVVVLVVAGFAVVAGLFVTLTVLDAGGWRKKLDKILLPIGFARCDADSDKAALAQRLRIVNPRHQGKRLLMHVYRRVAAGGDFTLYVCDYHFSSASGKARGGNWLLVCMVCAGIDLPRLSIDQSAPGSDLADRLMRTLSSQLDMPGMQHVATGTPELDQRFHVYTDGARNAEPALPVLLRELAAASGNASLDAAGDTLVLCSVPMLADRVRQVLDAQKLQGLLHLATRLQQVLTRP